MYIPGDMSLFSPLFPAQKAVLVDVECGSVKCVSEEDGAWSVMCLSHDLVVAQHATPTQTPRLVGKDTSTYMYMYMCIGV